MKKSLKFLKLKLNKLEKLEKIMRQSLLPDGSKVPKFINTSIPEFINTSIPEYGEKLLLLTATSTRVTSVLFYISNVVVNK